MVSGYDKLIHLWDLETKSIITTLEGHTSTVTAIAFNLSGELMASSSSDKTIRLWNFIKLAPIYMFQGCEHCNNSLAFSEEGKFLVSGSFKAIYVWNLETKALM